MNISSAKAAAAALFPAFIGAEALTGQAGLAAVIGLLSAILAAWLATRPALLKERNSKEAADEDRHERWLQSRIQYHSQVVVLLRQSKHNCVNYIDVCHRWIWREQEKARAEGRELPPFEFKYHDDLCGDEDRGMAALVFPSDIHLTGAQSGEHGGAR